MADLQMKLLRKKIQKKNEKIRERNRNRREREAKILASGTQKEDDNLVNAEEGKDHDNETTNPEEGLDVANGEIGEAPRPPATKKREKRKLAAKTEKSAKGKSE
ncbi:uncharacterized protein WCC33_013575 [Rhinophrynus dorsalis]